MNVLIHTAQVKEGQSSSSAACGSPLPSACDIALCRVEIIDLEDPRQCCNETSYAEPVVENANTGLFKEMIDS